MNRAARIASQIAAASQPAPQAPAANAVCGDKPPVKVAVTGAAGNIGYALVFMLAQGRMLGPHQKIDLRLLEIPQMLKQLSAIEMELYDLASPVIASVTCTDKPEVAFDKVDVALLVGAKPRGPGMERKDLLLDNGKIFRAQGQVLNRVASRDVKVLVVGNPANTNALIAMESAPDLPRENFTALTRLDHNRALAALAQRARVPVENVKNVVIWGNHSATQYPDVNAATVLRGGVAMPLRAAVNDDKWLNGEFIAGVQQRGAAIIKARGLSSAASAASAALEHMRDWLQGTQRGEWTSMAVVSDGSYGVPKGLIFSFPVTCRGGKWAIVQGLKIDAFSAEKLRLTTKELMEERDVVAAAPK